MAISVIHNPSDNKLGGLLQVLRRLLPQGGGLRLRGTLNLLRLPGSLVLSTLQELPAPLCGAGTSLLQTRLAGPFRICPQLLGLDIGGGPAFLYLPFHLRDLLNRFQ